MDDARAADRLVGCALRRGKRFSIAPRQRGPGKMAEQTMSQVSSSWMLIFFTAGAATVLFLVVLIAALVWFSYVHRKLLHAERMRAIETGHPLDMPDPGAQQA